ncbi:MAG TPA: hypothetical protein DCM71_16350 [Runella sp.]|nr:hypothetical protein [Runella sp.]
MQTNLNNSFQKSEIGQRVKILIPLLNLNQASFAQALDISPGRLSNVITGRNKPDSEFLMKIASVFKGVVNLEWLLTGEGDELLTNVNILRSQNRKPPIKTTNDTTNVTKNEYLLGENTSNSVSEESGHYLNNQMSNLIGKIASLEAIIKAQESTIRAYESALKAQDMALQTLKNAKFPTEVPMLVPGT